jgi:hypothetical protein
MLVWKTEGLIAVLDGLEERAILELRWMEHQRATWKQPGCFSMPNKHVIGDNQ